MENVVWPGDRLGSEGGYVAGLNTYTQDGEVYAAVLGQREERESRSQPGMVEVQVRRPSSQPPMDVAHVGDHVKGQVTRVTQRQAYVDVLLRHTKGGQDEPLGAVLTGVIRQELVREKDVDRVVVAQCFRPGDLVVAAVRGGWGTPTLILSTDQPHLGVVALGEEREVWQAEDPSS